ncbi:MAG TPA: YfdX family protein [Isosphaeraceae bacterium]|nr:YfdX family protein [Isosphaeraceae bacterium]
MRVHYGCVKWLLVMAGAAALQVVDANVWGQQSASSTTGQTSAKRAEPVVRTYGGQGSFRTEVSSRTMGSLSEEDRRQVSLLMAQVFEHIQDARDAIDADDTKKALDEVNKGREAIKAIRAMLPRTIVHTRTNAPDGKVLYEDERDVQDTYIPLYEGLLHTETLTPIIAAKRDALNVAGVHVVDAETIVTQARADLNIIESELTKAAKALGENKTDVAAKALAPALVRGVDLRFSKEDSPLVVARDALWLARRALEENNAAQAIVNLTSAQQRLRIYREVASQDERQEVDQMLREVAELDAQLRQERNQSASRATRAHQGNIIAQWWDKVNGWFRGRSDHQSK